MFIAVVMAVVLDHARLITTIEMIQWTIWELQTIEMFVPDYIALIHNSFLIGVTFVRCSDGILAVGTCSSQMGASRTLMSL